MRSPTHPPLHTPHPPTHYAHPTTYLSDEVGVLHVCVQWLLAVEHAHTLVQKEDDAFADVGGQPLVGRLGLEKKEKVGEGYSKRGYNTLGLGKKGEKQWGKDP